MDNFLLVYKKSGYELYSNSPDEKTRLFTEGSSDYAIRLRQNHKEHNIAIEKIIEHLEKTNTKYDLVYRADLEKQDLEKYSAVISLGGDGTLLDVSHHSIKTPIMGINTNPNGSVGFLCHSNYQEFEKTMDDFHNIPRVHVSRIQVSINGTPLRELALNDVLFAHVNPAAMTKYSLHGKRHNSSGLLASTGAGSTAFILNEGGTPFQVHENFFQYINRSELPREFKLEKVIEVESQTRESRVWIDGEHISYPITLGDILKMEMGPSLEIIGDLQRKQETYLKNKFV